MRQRDSYIDVAKGLAMLMIVRIHTECMGVARVPYPIIAVPFFFFLSGLYDKSERPLSQWLPKTFNSLVVTAFLWDIIGYSYQLFLQYIKNGNPNWWSIIENPFVGDGTVWFLVVLFMTKLLTAIMVKFPLPKYVLFLMTIAFAWISSVLHPYIWIDRILTALPIYYAGKLMYPYLDNISKNKTLLICGGGSLLYMWLFSFPSTLVEMSVGMNGLYYPVYLFITFMSFVPFLFISKKLENWKWMANYGTKTLGTLVFHPLLLHTCAICLNRLFTPESTIWYITFMTAYVVVCILCYYLTLLIERYCPVLLGKF